LRGRAAEGLLRGRNRLQGFWLLPHRQPILVQFERERRCQRRLGGQFVILFVLVITVFLGLVDFVFGRFIGFGFELVVEEQRWREFVGCCGVVLAAARIAAAVGCGG